MGAQISKKPPTHNVERFLFMLRFDSRAKVNALGCNVGSAASKTSMWRFKSFSIGFRLLMASHGNGRLAPLYQQVRFSENSSFIVSPPF